MALPTPLNAHVHPLMRARIKSVNDDRSTKQADAKLERDLDKAKRELGPRAVL